MQTPSQKKSNVRFIKQITREIKDKLIANVAKDVLESRLQNPSQICGFSSCLSIIHLLTDEIPVLNEL